MSIKRRKFEESIFKFLMRLSTLVIALVLILIIISIFSKGFKALDFDMLTKTPQGGYYIGKEGGILNAIVGSLYLSMGATIIAFLIGFPVAIYINIFSSSNSFFSNTIRVVLDVLWGIPSIVYGALGFTFMVLVGMKTSLFAAILIVSLVILPVIIRAIDEVIRLIPKGLLEASYSLGASKFQTSFKVIIRQAFPGIITAVLMAFGRAIGDTAAVLFTAGYTDNIPTSLFQATATLPLAIFFQLGSPIPEVQNRAYSAALILTVIILIISIVTRILIKKYNKFKI